ncbi:MAG: hypothetical protein HKL90_10985 [Elusimicrobia bacterium]|nr:hypothetical protein [Elusimicrobiota bacterium]
MKKNSISAGLLVIGAALCALSASAAAQTLQDADSQAAALIGSMKDSSAQAAQARRADAPSGDADCGVLPYEGLTQKGKWAIALDEDRYQKGIFESGVQSLGLLDFSARASALRDELSAASVALRRDEARVRGEIEAAGLPLKTEDLTIRRLDENVDYRVVTDRCGVGAIAPY